MRIVWMMMIGLMIGGAGWALPENPGRYDGGERPLVIVAVDKMDSMQLLSIDLPGVKKLLDEGACGLMNVRSGMGYIDSASGYLSLGTGSRSTRVDEPGPAKFGTEKSRNSRAELSGPEFSMLDFSGMRLSRGTFEMGGGLPGGTVESHLQWSLGVGVENLKAGNLVVPEIGWIQNQARVEDFHVDPGRLGAIFHKNGWRTCLIGNLDTITRPYRPGGFLLMDRRGVIDEGLVNETILAVDQRFPYQYRFHGPKAVQELSRRLADRKVILVEFGDFYRLDACREEMRPERYERLKRNIWVDFDRFLIRLFRLRETTPFTLAVTSPSVSVEAYRKRSLLGIFIIHAPEYGPGLLTSGTTKWPGLLANVDFLPTLLKMSNIQTHQRLTGRTASVIPVKNHRERLTRLNQRLIANNLSQRRILDWSMGLIAFGWIAGSLAIYWRSIFKIGKRFRGYLRIVGDWLITLVAVIPLSLLVIPLLPTFFWQVGGFVILAIFAVFLFTRIPSADHRIFILAGIIWGGLILDQLLGWRLIRFSPLGYSAMAGSRYYGMGNEFMGVFLAASLVLTHLIHRNAMAPWNVPKWLGSFILGISILVFSLPQLGAKFGGILSGIAGFSYYIVNVYRLNFKNKRLWLILAGCVLGLAAIGWWDSMRAPEVQTHIGRFIRLFFNRDFTQVGRIIIRKLSMNWKLTVFSPWMRIVLLALILGVIHRLALKTRLAQPEDGVLWNSVIATGLAAYMVNDAGVLAFATCLTFGFSFVLLKFGERDHQKILHHSIS
mgnify:CR=1 FL=1